MKALSVSVILIKSLKQKMGKFTWEHINDC